MTQSHGVTRTSSSTNTNAKRTASEFRPSDMSVNVLLNYHSFEHGARALAKWEKGVMIQQGMHATACFHCVQHYMKWRRVASFYIIWRFDFLTVAPRTCRDALGWSAATATASWFHTVKRPKLWMGEVLLNQLISHLFASIGLRTSTPLLCKPKETPIQPHRTHILA